MQPTDGEISTEPPLFVFHQASCFFRQRMQTATGLLLDLTYFGWPTPALVSSSIDLASLQR